MSATSARVVAVVAAVGLLGAGLAVAALRGGRTRTPEVAATAAALPVVTPARDAPPPAAPHGLGVIAVEGAAERHRGAERRALAVGDVIENNDWITTGRTSSVSLAGGEGGNATIRIHSSSRVRVDEASRGGARVTLDRGRLRAAAGSGATVAVRAADGRAAVEGSDADFTVQADAGAVRVVPHRNRVVLIARDERVEVPAGQGALVAGDQPPSLRPVPRSLLLKVLWPETSAQRSPQLEVRGETSPGATVRAGGAEVVADAHGRFTLTVPLREGQNVPRLVAEDLSGRRVTSTGHAVLVDRRRPQIEHQGVRYQE